MQGHLEREEEGPKPLAAQMFRNQVVKEVRYPLFRFEQPCDKFVHKRENRDLSQYQSLCVNYNSQKDPS